MPSLFFADKYSNHFWFGGVLCVQILVGAVVASVATRIAQQYSHWGRPCQKSCQWHRWSRIGIDAVSVGSIREVVVASLGDVRSDRLRLVVVLAAHTERLLSFRTCCHNVLAIAGRLTLTTFRRSLSPTPFAYRNRCNGFSDRTRTRSCRSDDVSIIEMQLMEEMLSGLVLSG